MGSPAVRTLPFFAEHTSSKSRLLLNCLPRKTIIRNFFNEERVQLNSRLRLGQNTLTLDEQNIEPGKSVGSIAFIFPFAALLVTRFEFWQERLRLYLCVSPCVPGVGTIIIGLFLDILKGVVLGPVAWTLNAVDECLQFILEVIDGELLCGLVVMFLEEMPNVLVEMTELQLQQPFLL